MIVDLHRTFSWFKRLVGAYPSDEEVLREALRILSEPYSWTRYSSAKNKAGMNVAVEDPAAVKFCAMGALQRAQWNLTGNYIGEQNHRLFNVLQEEAGLVLGIRNASVSMFNDDAENAESVLNLFRRGIERVK